MQETAIISESLKSKTASMMKIKLLDDPTKKTPKLATSGASSAMGKIFFTSSVEKNTLRSRQTRLQSCQNKTLMRLANKKK